jgi:hypothetical protein
MAKCRNKRGALVLPTAYGQKPIAKIRIFQKRIFEKLI